jgi:hypothetical protein
MDSFMAQRLLRRRQASQLDPSRDEPRERVLSEVTVVEEDEASEMEAEVEAAAAI